MHVIYPAQQYPNILNWNYITEHNGMQNEDGIYLNNNRISR
jgi:hypothetical protein